ncbi:MAG: hypothetical protein ACREVC_05935, partial [Burkholderiales bacterium]
MQGSWFELFNDNPQTYPQLLWITRSGAQIHARRYADNRDASVARDRQATRFCAASSVAAARWFG